MPNFRLHVKTVARPNTEAAAQVEAAAGRMFHAMNLVYESFGLTVKLASPIQHLDLLEMQLITIGECKRDGEPSDDQRKLFTHRQGVHSSKEIVAYFVRGIKSAQSGCAGHPAARPGVIVAANADVVVLAHEIAHLVLGPGHANDTNKLMHHHPSEITNRPPDLTQNEIKRMLNNPLIFND